MKTRQTSFRHILLFSYLSFSIPAMLLLCVLIFYTISHHMEEEIAEQQNLLQRYGNNMVQVMEDSEANLNSLTVLGSSLQLMHYGTSALQVHQAAYDLLPVIRSSVMQESCVGGYFLYDADFSYYCPVYRLTYPYTDQTVIREYLSQPLHPATERNCWIPVTLSDRTVLLRITGYDTTVCAVMIDPLLDNITNTGAAQQEPLFFYAAKNLGVPYANYPVLESQTFPWNENESRSIKLDSQTWRLLQYPLAGYDLQLCCLVPHTNILASMNNFQKMLLLCILLLFFYNAYMLVHVLYSQIVHPLYDLSGTMEKISSGSVELRIPENQNIKEYLHFSKTFNQMLDNIDRLKNEAYTKQLNLKQAQLQYLQLQIRPHFYLNCLKGLYSMAEKELYHQIQEGILSLADYFRYMFKNNQDFVSLSDEMHAVSSYLRLQELNFSRHPKVTMDIASDVVDVPLLPLSILTFVENSIKHASTLCDMEIHIHAALLSAENGKFLNISISDNCGGFSPEALETLNQLDSKDFLYQDYHVGIYNVYYRMKLTYGEDAVLAFYNNETGGTAELFIPLTKEDEAL